MSTRDGLLALTSKSIQQLPYNTPTSDLSLVIDQELIVAVAVHPKSIKRWQLAHRNGDSDGDGR